MTKRSLFLLLIFLTQVCLFPVSALAADTDLVVGNILGVSRVMPKPGTTLGSSSAVVPTAPSLHCLSVQSNGDVLLNWVVKDTSYNKSFHCYYIYSSTSPSGPFKAIDSIFSFGTNSYMNVGANANSISKYYYVEPRYLAPVNASSSPIDTLRTIFLSVVNPGTGTAHLNWNGMSTPLQRSSLKWYHIYQQYPAGTGAWKQIDSTQQLTYVDTIYFCHATRVNYRIGIGDSSGCTSVSNFAGGTFVDATLPAPILMDSVSVSSGGLAQLGWNQGSPKNTKGYVIYHLVNGIWIPIDTLKGISNTSYTYQASKAGSGSETYFVSAFDSCGNVSVLVQFQKSMYLKATQEVCAGSVSLIWNNFINMPKGTSAYDVVMTVDGGAATVVGSTASGDTTFIQQNLITNSIYCFSIVATNGATIRTHSNQICFTAKAPTLPKYNYLKYATVQGNNAVKICAYVDVKANVKQYDFYKAYTPSGNYGLIGTVPAPTSSTTISIIDTKVNTSLGSYYYAMYVVDSCGNEHSVSNSAHTILLNAVSNSATTTNVLTWNNYDDWLGTVKSYDIFRAIDGVWGAGPLANLAPVASGMNTYVDNVSAFYPSSGRFEYYIVAYEGAGNPYAFVDTSKSNIAEALQDADLYVPNAFTPGGKNPIFKAEGSFVNMQDYTLAVFDRWGEKVFETTDKTKGWDGVAHGKISEQGVYVYLITYKTSKGEFVDRHGTITLLH
jgi:gliding motility-associated-like protein